MKLIFEDTQARTIQGKERIVFSSFPSFHLLTVTARAKSQTQLPGAKRSAGLNMVIDGEPLPNSATFSGSQLRGLTQTLHVLTFLPGEEHTVSLETTKPQATAALEHVAIFAFDPEPTLILESDSQAEDGDRRPWITLVLKELPLFIFGESRNQSPEAKIAVGWVVKNRVGKATLIDPLNTQDDGERNAWHESYRIATEIIGGRTPDPTDGALFFHDNSMTTREFLTVVPRAAYIKQIDRMLFYGVKP